MRGGQMPVMVLDQMQMLDQEIAPARPVGEQRAHLVERRRIDLAAFGRARRPALAGAPAAKARRSLDIHGVTLFWSFRGAASAVNPESRYLL